MANPIMTPLEEQVMKDYGKYMRNMGSLSNFNMARTDQSFDNQPTSPINLPNMGSLNMSSFADLQNTNQPKSQNNLPNMGSLSNFNMAKAYASGGSVSQVPSNEANLDAWNNRADAAVRKDTAYRPGVAVTYSDGKFRQIVPQQIKIPIYGPSTGARTPRPIIGYEMVDAPTTGRGVKAPYEVAYSEDPREYIWDKFGNKMGRLPSTFGGVSNSFGLQNPFNINALGTDKALRYAMGGLIDKYAQGGEVQGYARGTVDGAFEEETEPTIMPYQMPEAPIAQEIPQPNFAPIQTGQVEPSGGGAIPMAPTQAMAPTMAMANPELNALLQQYNTGADYSAELKQARTDRRASEASFGKTLDSLMTTASDEGPSKAEMYFRLAAAFGTPTKTGAFGEGLAQAAGSMAETKKEERASRLSKRKLGAEIAMKKQELILEGAKDQEKTLLGLQAESNKDKREFIKAQVKEYIDSGKPQSNAGKIAKDKGFKPGTEEYQAEVDKQVNLEIEKQLGVINAQLLSGKVALANLGISQEKAQREAVKLEPDERKAIRDDEDAMQAGRSTIKNLDEALQHAERAFTSTKADQAAYAKLKQTNPNDPRVIATEQLDNLLGVNVLGSLKTTFGGNPTEGERSALKELGGLSAASPAARKQIINRAKKALEEAVDYRGARISKIESGGYRKKTEAEGKK
jgi:hypothetical protein